MDEKEFKDILGILDQAGWEAYPCDTPLPLYNGAAHCGNPAEPGEGVEKMVMYPGVFKELEAQFFLRAKGDSMKGARIEDGDMLRVDSQCPAHDNDVVVVCFDGEVTVKSLVTDEDGERWLVPANDAYSSIRLKDRPYQILGVVVAVENNHPRMELSDALKNIRRSKETPLLPLTDDMIANAVEEIAHEIYLRRLWISVYRPLKDRGSDWAEDYEAFCENVFTAVPRHPIQPSVRELQRMDVMSFAKPVRLWSRNDAPVDGKRFAEYLKLAQKFERLLREKSLKGKNRARNQ